MLDSDKNWHLKKELNIAHVLMTIGLAAGIVVWAMKTDSRLAQTEARLDAIQAAVVVERQNSTERHRELMQEMRAIRARLDAAIDSTR